MQHLLREPETQRNARPFGSSMAEWQRFGCLDTWLCNSKQKPSLRFPIEVLEIILRGKDANLMDSLINSV